MTHEEPQKSSNGRGFLGLPLELRRIIYRHLLVPDPVVKLKRKGYGLKPAVLLVNKLVHNEASLVLYQENNWVLFNVIFPLTLVQGPWTLRDTMQRYHLIRLAEKTFIRKPCMELQVRKLDQRYRGLDPRYTGRNPMRFVVLLDGLPLVCQILTAFRKSIDDEIFLDFAKVKANVLDEIINCLGEISGYHHFL